MKVKSDFLKPRWSKIASDLWEDKTRTGLVVASIAVGVFAIGMIITAFTILNKDVMKAIRRSTRPTSKSGRTPFKRTWCG